MKPTKSYFIVMYDISDSKRLRHVAKITGKYLNRVLYSVFEGELTDKQLFNLQQEIKNHIMLEDDSVIYFKLCPECVTKIHTRGRRIPVQLDKDFIVV
ncbi:MAG: CRISPR-associated endonuclease Cas2 [Deltaproteobacteria bacterium]|nr:CRISPR-associated endonuclease Cas2 [Deltaproteobacteria bacterium]